MSISPSTIDELRKELVALPPKPKTVLTARDAIVALAPEIELARRAGYALKDIAVMLTDRGMRIGASTLGSYLRALEHGSASRPAGGKVRAVRAAS